MFRDKKFLIEQGMSDKCRDDIFYFVGAMYDEVKVTHEISEKRYKEIKNYLEENRGIIGGKEYSLGLYETVCKRFRESFDWGQDIKVIWEEEKKKERERNAAQLNEESGYGVYGIYVNNILVYVGETTQSFRERFMEHRNHLLKEDNRKLYSYLN